MVKKFENWMNENVFIDAPKSATDRYKRLFYDICEKEGIPSELEMPLEGWVLDDFLFETGVNSIPYSNGGTKIFIGFFYEDVDEIEVNWESDVEGPDQGSPLRLNGVGLKNLSKHLESVNDKDYFAKVIELVVNTLKDAISRIASIWIDAGVDIQELLDLAGGDVDLIVRSVNDQSKLGDLYAKLRRIQRSKQAFGM